MSETLDKLIARVSAGDQVTNSELIQLDTPEEIRRVSGYFSTLRHGMKAGVPLQCAADKCPMCDACPLYAIHKAPQGEPCPLELDLIEKSTQGYFEAINLDPANFLDRSYVSELVKIDILEWRIGMLQAIPEHAGLTVLDVKEVDEDGHPIAFERKESPLLNSLERFHNKRVRLMKDLMATREATFRAATIMGKPFKKTRDLSTTMSEARNVLFEKLRTGGMPVKELPAENVPAATSPDDSD